MEIENNHTWASQEGGEPLRNTNPEDNLGLELLFRANSHGPQPIITPRALPETTFSISNTISLFSKLQLEKWIHTVLSEREVTVSHLPSPYPNQESRDSTPYCPSLPLRFLNMWTHVNLLFHHTPVPLSFL